MPPFENEDDVWVGLYSLSLEDDDDDATNKTPNPVPLTGVKVEAQIVDFVAEVKLSQCFHNTSDKTIEAIYHFPIHEGAAVCGFQAEYEDGSIVKGIVKEKQTAKAEYAAAKTAGKQANLLESVRRDIFTLSVGNVPAGGYVKITVLYVMTLEARDDAAAFILPTCIAPRYSPAPASTTPGDAQALAPPGSAVKLFGLDINIDVTCRSSIQDITSPTHESAVRATMAGKTGRICLADITMDRDIVILIKEEHNHQPRASLEVAEDGSMTGFVTFYPQIEFPDQKREFIFVVDRSGSMGGQKIAQARDTLLLFLRSLPASCTFNIVGFGSRHAALFDAPKPYNDETLEAASQYAYSMNADMGGTEIARPLREIFNQKPPHYVERQVFVLTDGQVSNDMQVFVLIHQNCNTTTRACRLFSVGIGQGVSRHLVSGMARAGRGTSRFVEDGSANALRVKVLGQLKQSLQPSLENVSIKWKVPEPEKKPVIPASNEVAASPIKTLLGYRSPSVDEAKQDNEPQQSGPKMYPSINPPVFNKEKYLSFAMFPPGSSRPESVTVTCETSDGPLQVELNVSEEEVFQGSIARKLAARTAITEYEDHRKGHHGYHAPRYSSLEPEKMISQDEALQLALKTGLASDQTSFVAIRENPVVDPNAPRVTKVIPQHCGADQSRLWADREEAERGRPVYQSAQSAAFCSGARFDFNRSRPERRLALQSCHNSKKKWTDCGSFDFNRSRPEGRRNRCGGGMLRHSQAQQQQQQQSLPPPPQESSSQYQPPTRRQRRIDSDAPSVASSAITAPMSNMTAAAAEQRPTLRSARFGAAPAPGAGGGFGSALFGAAPSAPSAPAAAPPAPGGFGSVYEGAAPCPMNVQEEYEEDDDVDMARTGTAPGPAKSSDQVMMQLCMLQKADGSFILNDDLIKAVGMPKSEMDAMLARVDSASDKIAFATALVIAILRVEHSKKRNVWELQEQKALALLAGKPHTTKLLSVVEAEIRSLKRNA